MKEAENKSWNINLYRGKPAGRMWISVRPHHEVQYQNEYEDTDKSRCRSVQNCFQ
jgi:hypothetical protein